MTRQKSIVAIVHTHPNSNEFSGLNNGKGDVGFANYYNVNIYMVGPNLHLQRYNVSDGSVDAVCAINPSPLDDEQRVNLAVLTEESWDAHVRGGYCGFGCPYMTWPNPNY
jgi:hypothetical protein